MEIYSFDLPAIFYKILHDQDLRQGYYTIEKVFNNFPREEDSVPIVILKSIDETCGSVKHRLIIELLIKYYLYLLDISKSA